MDLKKIKIVIGDITKILKINSNISFKQFIEVVRGAFDLNKEDIFYLKYNDKELNERNYKEIIKIQKLKFELFLEGGCSLILKSLRVKKTLLREDLDGISKTLYDYNQENNYPKYNELNIILETINNLGKTIIDKLKSHENSINKINKKLDEIKNEKNKSNNNLSNYSNNYFNDKKLTNEYCSECQTYLSQIKYECIFCPKPKIFCRNCAQKHILHPLLQFDMNINYKELNNGNLIINYLKNKYSTDLGMSDNFPINNTNKISYFDVNDIYANKIELSLLNITPYKIVLPINQQSLIKIQIFNNSLYFINKIQLIINGGKRVKIQNCGEISLQPLEKKNISLGIIIEDGADNEQEIITFSIMDKDNISVEPLVITFFIINGVENAKSKNLDIYLEDKDIINIDEEDKIKLLSLMKENEPFNESEVNEILKKYKKKKKY